MISVLYLQKPSINEELFKKNGIYVSFETPSNSMIKFTLLLRNDILLKQIENCKIPSTSSNNHLLLTDHVYFAYIVKAYKHESLHQHNGAKVYIRIHSGLECHILNSFKLVLKQTLCWLVSILDFSITQQHPQSRQNLGLKIEEGEYTILKYIIECIPKFLQSNEIQIYGEIFV